MRHYKNSKVNCKVAFACRKHRKNLSLLKLLAIYGEARFSMSSYKNILDIKGVKLEEIKEAILGSNKIVTAMHLCSL